MYIIFNYAKVKCFKQTKKVLKKKDLLISAYLHIPSNNGTFFRTLNFDRKFHQRFIDYMLKQNTTEDLKSSTEHHYNERRFTGFDFTTNCSLQNRCSW